MGSAVNLKPSSVRSTIRVFMVPGKEQTLEDLVEKYAERVIEVDTEHNRIKVSEESWLRKL